MAGHKGLVRFLFCMGTMWFNCFYPQIVKYPFTIDNTGRGR